MTSPAPEHHDRLQQARELLPQRRFAEAKTLLVTLRGENSEDWRTFHLLAAVHMALGEHADAEQCARQAIALQPGAIGAHINLGCALTGLGRNDEAMSCFHYVLSLKPEEAQAHGNLGVLLQKQGRLDEAEASYRTALRHAPDYPDALANLGNLLHQQGKSSEAFDCCQKALQIRPGHPETLYNLGCALHALGKWSQAATCFEDLTRRVPADARAWSALGLSYRSLKEHVKAVAACRQAIALRPDNADAHYTLGIVHQTAKDLDTATAEFREALRLDPSLDRARYHLAMLGGEDAPKQAPADYVEKLFDDYAASFDQHLVKNLKYRTPELLSQAVRRVIPPGTHKLDTLDLGCGTGLSGEQFRDLARRLVGTDLSRGMIQKARARGIYDELIVGDLLDPLRAAQDAFDLVIAVDVFVYIGDLSDIFFACAQSLRANGLFAFSVEALDSGDYLLRKSGRYAHNADYLRRLARNAGMEELSFAQAELRRESEQPVMGYLSVMRRMA